MNFAFEDDEYCDFMTDVPNVHRQYVQQGEQNSTYMRALEIFIQTSNPV